MVSYSWSIYNWHIIDFVTITENNWKDSQYDSNWCDNINKTRITLSQFYTSTNNVDYIWHIVKEFNKCYEAYFLAKWKVPLKWHVWFQRNILSSFNGYFYRGGWKTNRDFGHKYLSSNMIKTVCLRWTARRTGAPLSLMSSIERKWRQLSHASTLETKSIRLNWTQHWRLLQEGTE